MGDLCSLKEKLMLWLYRNLLVHISGPDTCTRTASTTESLKGHGHEPSLSPQNPFGLNGQTPITPPQRILLNLRFNNRLEPSFQHFS